MKLSFLWRIIQAGVSLIWRFLRNGALPHLQRHIAILLTPVRLIAHGLHLAWRAPLLARHRLYLMAYLLNLSVDWLDRYGAIVVHYWFVHAKGNVLSTLRARSVSTLWRNPRRRHRTRQLALLRYLVLSHRKLLAIDYWQLHGGLLFKRMLIQQTVVLLK